DAHAWTTLLMGPGDCPERHAQPRHSFIPGPASLVSKGATRGQAAPTATMAARRHLMDRPARKVALVTGSGRQRIGWYVADALAGQGYDLVVHYRTSAT